jgi:signal transduction histidine kinase
MTKNIIKINLVSNVVIITILMLFSIGAVAYVKYKHFSCSYETIKEELINEKKLLMKTIVDESIRRVEISQNNSKIFFDGRLRQRVHNSYQIATNLYNKYKDKMSEKELKELIKDSLRSIRYGAERGYIFITSMEGEEILYPVKPEFEGKNIIDLQDAKGNFVIKNEINLLKTADEGFLNEYWIDHKTNKEDKKRVFIKKFEPFNWYIGTGFYLSDATIETQNRIKRTLTHLRFGEKGESYLYILDWKNRGLDNQTIKTVVHPLLGDDKWLDINKKDSTGFAYRKEYLKQLNSKKDAFLLIHIPKLGTTKEYEKLIYVQYYPKWNWIIGSGVYLDRLEVIVQKRVAILQEQLTHEIWALSIVFVLAILSAFFISRRFSNILNQIVDGYKEEITKRENELKLLNLSLQDKVEEKTEELQTLNRDLEYQIKKAVQEINNKNEIIVRDSTLRAQAETLSMVAHQWRQPLNSISLLVSNISIKNSLSGLTNEELEDGLNRVSGNIQKLSSLIDEFRSVFGEVSLYEIEFNTLKHNIISLIKLKYQNMDINFNISENDFDIKILSSEKKLDEIFEDIIQNSVDALSENESKNIYIEFKLDERYLSISIIDNGKGVPIEERDKLFEAYFSTKSLNSSGLSLYMAKVSLQKMNANIEYKPRNIGSEFIIKLPIIK